MSSPDDAVAGPSTVVAEAAAAACPICLARLPSAAVLSAHMATHSKDEIVSELLRKTARQATQNAVSVPDAVAATAQGHPFSELMS